MAYFSTKEPVRFFSSGTQVLDNILGGGWPESRLINIQGGSSVGKTCLALEAIANHLIKYKELSQPHYCDAEKAFDLEYNTGLGIPIERIKFDDEIYTVEDWYNKVSDIINSIKSKTSKMHGLIVLDSLDALSDEAERERDINDGSYGTKAKKLSELFRRVSGDAAINNITIVVISQLRDKFGPIPGLTQRSGGKAVEYYSSIILKLKSEKKLVKTLKGIDIPIGLQVNAQCIKNKVGIPWKECSFKLFFGHGIDDVTSNLEWLLSDAIKFYDNSKIPVIGTYKLTDIKQIETYVNKINDLPKEEKFLFRKKIADLTKEIDETIYIEARKTFNKDEDSKYNW